MKKRVVKKDLSCRAGAKNLDCGDVGLIKWSVIFGTLFLIGLLGYWIQPVSMINFIIKWKWVSLLLALLIGLRPLKKFCGGCK